MDLRPINAYARELKPDLPPGMFEPARSRLLWVPVSLTIIVTCMTAIAAGWVPLYVAPLLSIVIGVGFSVLTFLAHETLHGAVVRSRAVRYVIGILGFLPFLVSPRLWIGWHNKVHHGNTSRHGIDPDMYPTLAVYEKSKVGRVVSDHFSLGPGHRAGLISIFLGFTFQSARVLWLARTQAQLSVRERRFAFLEFLAFAGVWAVLASVVGFVPFLFVFVMPLLVANAMVMMYILTNHHLSPLTGEVNDALVNSLSVTVPRWLDFVTLGFGYHTEHHIFPSMSTRHAPQLKALIQARWPERYQSMPLSRALRALMNTGRVYKTPTVLCEPRTGKEFATVGTVMQKHAAAAAVVAGAVPSPSPLPSAPTVLISEQQQHPSL